MASKTLDDTLVTNLSWIAESHEHSVDVDSDWEIEMFAEPAPGPAEDYETTGVWAPSPSLLRQVKYSDEEPGSGCYFSLQVGDDPEEATTPPSLGLRLLF